MAINKKLIKYATKARFTTDLGNSLIPDTSIVFIQDTGELWTHGIFFGGHFSSVDSNYGTLTLDGSSVNLSLYGHKHSYTDLLGSTTTANQAIVSNGTANGWTLATLGSNAFNSTSYLPLSGGVLSGAVSSTASTPLSLYYSGNQYATIVNHNNGNVSISAASGGLYLGYYNTSNIYCRGSYENLDSGNYSSYNPLINGAHATNGTSIYAPTSQLSVQNYTTSYLVGTPTTTSFSPVYSNPSVYMNGSTLYASNFIGNITGNLTGTASQATTSFNSGIVWTANVTVGSWSSICALPGTYGSYILTLSFSQSSEASCNTYLISTGYTYAKIIQIGFNNFPVNNSQQVRLTQNGSSPISCFVEVLEPYGYNGATTLSVPCSINRVDHDSVTAVAVYTANTPTAGGTVWSSLVSSRNKIVADLGGTADTATLASTISANSSTTTQAYLLGVTSSGTTPIYDPGIYITSTSGTLHAAAMTATTFTGNLSGTASYATKLPVYAGNECVIHDGIGSGSPAWINYRGSSGSGISMYRFGTGLGDGTLAPVYASDFRVTTNGYNVLHSGNYNSYSPTLTGGGATGTWNISIAGFTSTNSGNPQDANNTVTNGMYYYTSNGPTGMSTSDGGLYVQAYSSAWVGQIAQDYRNGRLAVRGKNSGTWTAWLQIIDSSNIGSQSVSYASSAGSVAWTNVSGRPTALSSFTNDSGFITSSGTAYAATTLSVTDNRGVDRTPDYYATHSISTFFNSSIIGSWKAGITVKGWSADYASWQLFATSTSSVDDTNLYFRQGINSTWNSVITLITSNNIASQSVSYANSAGNASTLGSLSLGPTANTTGNAVVRTDGNGYIQCGYINSASGGGEKNASSPPYVWGTNGSDTYLRTYATNNLSVAYAANAGAIGGYTTANIMFKAGGTFSGTVYFGTSSYNINTAGTANFNSLYVDGNLTLGTGDLLGGSSMIHTGGIVRNVITLTSGTTYLTNNNHTVICNNSSDIHIYLPSAPNNGQEFVIKQYHGAANYTIHFNGLLWWSGNNATGSKYINDAKTYIYTWCSAVNGWALSISGY